MKNAEMENIKGMSLNIASVLCCRLQIFKHVEEIV
jgi:hypothetical protein